MGKHPNKASRKPKTKEGPRLSLRPPHAMKAYLDDLVTVGIYGNTKSEVAVKLLSNEIERLIANKTIALRNTPKTSTEPEQPS